MLVVNYSTLIVERYQHVLYVVYGKHEAHFVSTNYSSPFNWQGPERGYHTWISRNNTFVLSFSQPTCENNGRTEHTQ